MKFLMRGIVGLLLIAVMLGSVGFGAYRLFNAMTAEQTARGRAPVERSYSVNVSLLEPQTVQPVTTAYGEIESWRTLQLRASSDGRIVNIAKKFRDGAAVAAGDLLVRIDPADAEFAVLDAEAALSDAQAQKAEAEEAVVVAEQELVAARRQLELRKQALERQKQLKEKGYSTAVQVEAEQLSVAALEQALNNRLQSVITARKRIERMDLSVERAQIAVKNAQRVLAETSIEAPFDGYLDQVDAVLGRRVNPSDTLGVLIDPEALEVRFSLSTQQFSRFLDDAGALVDADVTAELELGDRTIEIKGHLDRVSAVVGEGEAGRAVFASLDVSQDAVLRPGDFVTVRLRERPLSDVAEIPATAATEDGRILIIDSDNRLTEVSVRILRRMKDTLVVDEVPFGSSYVRERLPHLGPGLKVEPRGAPGATTEPLQNDNNLVSLEPSRRAELQKLVEASGMPEDRKARLQAALKQPRVPKDLIERLEQRQGRRG